MAKVKRSQILTYINTTPESPAILSSATATYVLLGDGIVSAKIGYNPKETEEQYIAEDSSRKSVDSFAETLPIEQTCKLTDPAFEFLDWLRLDRSVMGEAETTLVHVWNYETGGPTAAPAEEQKVCIAMEQFGGAGGGSLGIKYTAYSIGTRAAGTFNTSTKVFTAT